MPSEERVRFATEVAKDDANLLSEVLDLLRLHASLAPDAARPSPLPDSIGAYRVLARLGGGGMGVVYKAQRGAEAPVAIKVLAGGVIGDRLSSRLAREAVVLKRLGHPAIARFIESGTHETSFGNQPYVVMELIEGVTLQEWARLPDVDLRTRLARIAEICDAVQHAHERGVIHRDLKPANILVDADGRPHILDFGVARLTDSGLLDATLLTRSAELLGTVRYMSPEQAQGLDDAIDARTDVYSLGVVAYEVLADRPPYDLQTRSLTRALVMVATVDPPPAGRHRRALKGEVESILEKALQKRREDRYASMAAMAADIRRFLSERPVTAATGRMWRRTRSFVRRHRLAVPLTLLLVAGISVAIVTVPWLRHRVPGLAWEDLRSLDDQIVDADAALHVDRPAAATLDSLLRVYQSARRLLDSYPGNAGVLDLRRYIHWRLGEAYYMLGVRVQDPDSLARSLQWFSRVHSLQRPRGYSPPLPSTLRLARCVRVLSPVQGLSGMGMVEAELATYRQPQYHMRRSRSLRWGVLSTYAQSIGQGGRDPLRIDPIPHVEAYGFMLNEYGETLSAIGELADSVALLDRALGCFATADSLERNMADRIAYASLLFNRGMAYLRRAELASGAADLDSAEALLDAALTIREEARRPSRVDARLALSRLERARARGDNGPTQAGALDRAAAHAAAALAVLDDDHAPPAALVPALLAEAEGALDRFDELGDGGAVDRAERSLARARSGLDPERAPYPAAWHALVEARLLRARWEMAPAPDRHRAASAALERARDAMPRDQDRPFNRRVESEAKRLGIPAPR